MIFVVVPFRFKEGYDNRFADDLDVVIVIEQTEELCNGALANRSNSRRVEITYYV